MQISINFEKASLPALLRESAARHSDQTAINFAGQMLDYTTLDQQSDRVAAHLTAKGIQKGDRIGLYCINTPEFIIAYFAILKAGAIVVPVNLLYSPDEVQYVLNDTAITGLIYHSAFAETVAAIRAQLSDLHTNLVIAGTAADENECAWESALDHQAPTPSPSFDTQNDIAVVLYTSGTTGRPKGAMLTHRNLAMNVLSAGDALQLQPGHDRFMLVLPLFHSFAATVGMLLPIFTGCTIILQTRFDPAQVASAIAAEQATIFLGVPTMYNYLLQLPSEATDQLTSLRLCISGGAALPVALMKQFEQRFNQVIYEGDGPTECGPVTCVNPIGGERKPASVGLPIPRVDMKIMDADAKECPIGKMGELCVRGPSVMKGYWNLPEATQATFFGDWFRTGDLGYQDQDGYFYIVDRLKDLVIYNGMNVYPRIIEETLYQHPAVQEAAVIGEPHPVHGEIPVAHLALKEGQRASSDDIISYCDQKLDRHEIPKKVIFVDALPKNAAGKILKRELRRHGEIERGIVERK